MESLIKETLQDRKRFYVFPSQVAASFWLRESLQRGWCRALEEERFISWDRFKEAYIQRDRPEKPAHLVLRTLYASKILAENRDGAAPFFSSLIPPEFRGYSESFLPSLVALLPRLGRLSGDPELLARGTGTGMAADILGLKESYQNFLDAKGFFEPSWMTARQGSSADGGILFFPQLIEDYEEYRTLVEGMGLQIGPGSPEAPEGLFHQFPNSRQELDWVLARLRDHLTEGVPPDSIAITCLDDDLGRDLAQKGRFYGLPLVFRWGKPLADYPAGALLEQLEGCASERFSLESLKALLLSRTYRWKDEGLNRDLVAFGIRFHCFANTGQRGRGDLWGEKLAKQGRHDLREYYRQLRHGIEGLIDAPTPGELTRRFQVFITRFLITDEGDWDRECLLVFQRCRRLLGDLALLEEELGEWQGVSPFGLWKRLLNSRIYVPEQPEEGIPVYPYRVSAGTAPAFHYLIGANQNSVRAAEAPIPFLSDEARQVMGCEPRDYSDRFLEAYSRAPGFKAFTGSRETGSGAQLAPGYFVSQGLLAVMEDTEEITRRDPLRLEAREWGAGEPRSGCGCKNQALALERYLKAGGNPGRDLIAKGRGLSPALCRELFDQDSGGTEPPLLTLSPTGLNTYRQCPYAFLLQHQLKIRGDDYRPQLEDNRKIGVFYHQVLYRFFKAAGDRGPYRGEEKELNHELLLQAYGSTREEWERTGKALFPPVWETLQQTLWENLELLLAAEEVQGKGYRAAALEQEFSLDWPEQGLRLCGTLDRLSVDSGERPGVVVDYKKSYIPDKKEKFWSDGEDPYSFQLPFYALLAEAAGYGRVRPAYYSIQKGQYLFLNGAGGLFSDEEMEELMEYTRRAAGETGRAIRDGVWPVSEDCEPCRYRAVCRRTFTVR